jgi:hypothetical protein
MTHRVRTTSVIVAAVLVLATACSTGSPPHSSEADNPTITAPSDPPSATPESPTAGSADVVVATAPPADSAAAESLTGFGASESAWERTRKPDSRFDSGSSYNAGFVDNGDTANDQYYAVTHSQGQIQGFSERFAPGTTATLARHIVTQNDLPSDAKVLWTNTQPTCQQIQFTSTTLLKAGVALNHGGVLFTFVSDEVGGPFRTSKIAYAVVLPLYDATAAANPGC